MNKELADRLIELLAAPEIKHINFSYSLSDHRQGYVVGADYKSAGTIFFPSASYGRG